MRLSFFGSLLALALPVAAQTYRVASYAIPTAPADLTSITTGPDGNLWFTEFRAGKVGICTPTGQVSELTLSSLAGAAPFGITTGPDGNLWLTDYAQSFIIRMTARGNATRFLIPTPNAAPTLILAGPDGALWFLESNVAQIGRLDLNGNFREYAVPGTAVQLEGMAIGSDGGLWFTDTGNNRIGRFDLVSAAFTEFPVPSTAGTQTLGLIAAGPDGALWFTEPNAAEIGRIDTSGNVTQFALLSEVGRPFAIASSGGMLLFTTSVGTIGKITTDGVAAVAAQLSMPSFTALATGPDDAVWFGGSTAEGAMIGRVALPMTIARAGAPDGYLNVAYAGQLAAQYGVGPVTWSVTGSLPPGLSLNTSTGQITGSPTATGTFSFSASASDASSPPQTAFQNFTVNIGMPQFVALTTYDLPAISDPGVMRSITSGPDGNLWFTEQAYAGANAMETGTNRIDRISTKGVLSQFNEKIPFGNGPSAIISAPDGNLWFILQGAAMGGEIETSGMITRRALSDSARSSIEASNDGTIWIGGANELELLAGGSDETLTLPVIPDSLAGLALASDGGMWTGSSGAMWRISMDRRINYFPLARTVQPLAVTSTADNSVWFTQANSAEIGRVTSTGQLSAFAIPSGDLGMGIATDTDGNVWFAGKQSVIGRLTAAGSMIEYPVGGAHSITNGPDGAIWFVQDKAGGHIGRLAAVHPLLASFVLPTGEVERPYGPAAIAAQGGAPPYDWTLGSGSALPPGMILDPLTGVLSGTPTAAGNYTFLVQVSDQSLPYPQSVTQRVTLLVSAPLAISSNTLPNGVARSVYSATVPIQGGTAPYTCSLLTGSLPGGLSLSGCAVAGTPLSAGTSSFTIGVRDGVNATAAASYLLQVNAATSSSGGAPSPTPPPVPVPVPKLSLGGLPASGELTGPMKLSVSLDSTAKTDITGTVSLSFEPSPAGLPFGYIDPALQFVDTTSGMKYGTSYTFTIPVGSTTATLPAIEPGTVAGNLSLEVTTDRQPADSVKMTIPESAPVIEPNSVQIVVNSSMGFWVQLVASSTTRQVNTLTLAFSAASGASLTGNTTFTFDVSSPIAQWYATQGSQAYGSLFTLGIPFAISGSASSIGFVTATLSNSAGTSAPVSGTQ